jgi:hypothetical protein
MDKLEKITHNKLAAPLEKKGGYPGSAPKGPVKAPQGPGAGVPASPKGKK